MEIQLQSLSDPRWQHRGSSIDDEKKTPSLVWEDVRVVVANNLRKGGGKKLLNGVSGFGLADRIMAVMGPSGSGKSTLLDALAGRLALNTIMTGNILLSGKKISRGSRCNIGPDLLHVVVLGSVPTVILSFCFMSHVTQEDVLLGTLTVRETLMYSAHLRLPSSMMNHEINAIVENTIMKMGLQDCADKKIGNWHLRGISSGEKRRLTISLELLTQPHVMFLDEPTSGLDSASAFFIVQALKKVALDGKIVVCSIHQPSSYVFDLFDDLCLLSNGETVYFGEAKLAVKFFAEAGFPCPTRRNPPDHFLRCINSDFDKITTLLQSKRDYATQEPSSSQMHMTTEEIKALLIEKYKCSAYSINTRKIIRETKLITEQLVIEPSENNCSLWKQIRILTRRTFVHMNRDLGYYWIRIVFCILLAITSGILFFSTGLSNSTFVARFKLYCSLYNLMVMLCIGALPSFIEEWKVLSHERSNGHYKETVFLISNFMASFPFMAILSIIYATIVYYMVKFQLGFSHLSYFCINIFCCTTVTETIAMIIVLLVPNFLMGIGVSVLILGLMIIAAGLLRPWPEIPKLFWRYPMSYISFISWAVQGQFKNDMIGLEFESAVAGGQKLKGEEILQTHFGVESNHSKWVDLAAVFFLLFCHRLLFFMILKYQERASFLLSRLSAKRTTPMVAKPASFRMENYTSSRRNQPLHSLASQEGLASPLT